MNEIIKRDLEDSIYDFKRLVYPKLLEQHFISGELLSVEARLTENIAQILDNVAGIDVLIRDANGIIGIASRIQWPASPYNTFTIRADRVTGTATELIKRQAQVFEGGKYLYPYWTCQAYITERRIGSLLSLGLAKTQDVFTALLKCSNATKHSDNKFIAIKWDDMRELGYNVQIWSLGRYRLS